jgi:histidinol-phosphate aminotransferase
MSQYWNAVVHNLTPYIPGEQPAQLDLIKLNTNENPYPPSAKAISAMQAAIGDRLRLYPDPNGTALKDAIANHTGLKRNQAFIGNSSDEVLAHTFQALLKKDKPLLFPDISYGFYSTYASLYEIDFRKVALNAGFEIDVSDYDQECGAIIIANPNAPTGCALSLKKIETLLKSHPDQVVVVDEAYVDFGAESAVSLINHFNNLLVVQTLSKSRSLAGLRVGFALGHADLIEGLERVKNSFNCYPLDSIALVGAVAAVEDVDYFKQTCAAIVATRNSLTPQLIELGFDVLPSQANFVFMRHPKHDAAELAAALREKSILVRHFRQPRIDQYLRISIGTDEECSTLLKQLTAILSRY